MAKAKSGARSAAEVAVATLLFLCAAFLLFRHTVYQLPAPPADQPQGTAQQALAAPAPQEAVVLSVAGSVERARGSGPWSRLVPGEHLKADESIRTGKTGRTNLRIGDKSTLAVTESTQVTIRELTRAVHRFRLERGRLAVDYKPDGERVLKIESESSGAVAETRGARFSILSTGSTIAVATETGSVNLRAAQREVEVHAGQIAAVRQGDAAPLPRPRAECFAHRDRFGGGRGGPRTRDQAFAPHFVAERHDCGSAVGFGCWGGARMFPRGQRSAVGGMKDKGKDSHRCRETHRPAKPAAKML